MLQRMDEVYIGRSISATVLFVHVGTIVTAILVQLQHGLVVENDVHTVFEHIEQLGFGVIVQLGNHVSITARQQKTRFDRGLSIIGPVQSLRSGIDRQPGSPLDVGVDKFPLAKSIHARANDGFHDGPDQ
uniref:Putative secreted protein n=1 Tax=Anopheles darlingi TaxID=43151 RepID=A0A2M4D454_ANODA